MFQVQKYSNQDFSNSIIFDPTLCRVFNFWEEFLKLFELFCIFCALLRLESSPFGLLSFWPGAHKMRETLCFWQLIQVQSNLVLGVFHRLLFCGFPRFRILGFLVNDFEAGLLVLASHPLRNSLQLKDVDRWTTICLLLGRLLLFLFLFLLLFLCVLLLLFLYNLLEKSAAILHFLLFLLGGRRLFLSQLGVFVYRQLLHKKVLQSVGVELL